MIEKIFVPSGAEVLYQLDYPTGEEVYNHCPIVFLAPSFPMKDLNGNGQGYSVKNSLEDLSQALNRSGRATFRYSSSHPLPSTDVRYLYEICIKAKRSRLDSFGYIGFCDNADDFAKSYYDYYRICSPDIAILISSFAEIIDFNNLTCPYLIIHGAEDPSLKAYPQESFDEAVHHHQMRYGDATTHLVLPHLSKELGKYRLDDEVIREILYWLKSVPFAPDHTLMEFWKSA